MKPNINKNRFHNIIIVNFIISIKKEPNASLKHLVLFYCLQLSAYVLYTQIGFGIDIFAVYHYREMAMIASRPASTAAFCHSLTSGHHLSF